MIDNRYILCLYILKIVKLFIFNRVLLVKFKTCYLGYMQATTFFPTKESVTECKKKKK